MRGSGKPSRGRKTPSVPRPDDQRAASGYNVPTVQPNPRRRYTVVMNDQSDNESPFTGTVTYQQIMGALRYQISTHLTPALGAESPDTVWAEPWRYLQIQWVKAWGNPFVNTDKGSGVKFSVDLESGQGGSRAPPPDKFDFASGSSDRPYGMVRGSAQHWAEKGIGANVAISLQDADLLHVGVLVW